MNHLFPPQIIFVPSNPNLPSDWNLGFGNRILPFIDTAEKIQDLGLSIPVGSPFFGAAHDLSLFDRSKYVCAPEGMQSIATQFEHVVQMYPRAAANDYLRVFQRYSSVAIVESFPTNDPFDETNWRAANRPGGIYRPFDFTNQKQMEFTNACLQLKSSVAVDEIVFDEDCIKVCIFLRLGLTQNDRHTWVRQEYPAKFFSDRDFNIFDNDGEEEFRMSPSLIINAVGNILEQKEFEDRKLHIQIMSDFNANLEQRKSIMAWFQHHFEEKRVKVSFERSTSMWRDLLYKTKNIDAIIGGSSDFLRVAITRNLEGSREQPLHVYMPQPDVIQQKQFLQPHLTEMKHIVI